MEKRASNFILQGGILAITGILVRIIGMIYRIPMVNIIGSDGNGIYGAAYNIYNIVLILSSFGMPMAVSKLISSRLVKGEYKNAKNIFIRAIIVSLISGGVAAGFLFFGADFIEKTLYAGIPGTAIPLRILAPTVLIVAVLGTVRGFFEGHGSMVETAASQFFEQVVNAIVSIVAAYAFIKAFAATNNVAAYGAAGGTLGTCLGAVAGLFVVLYILYRNKNKYKKRLANDEFGETLDSKTTYKLIIMTIVPIIIGQTFYNISAVIDDVIYNNVALATMSAKEVTTSLGNYNTSYSTLISIPMGIACAMASSLLPSVVHSYSLGDKRAINKKLRHTISVTMLVAIPFTIALTVLGGPIISLLFSRYDSVYGALMLKVGSCAIIFFTLATVTSTTLQGIDKMKLPIIHSAIALAIHIPLIIFLLVVFKLGTIALVIGAMIFSLTVLILNLRALKRYTGYRQEWFKTFITPFICAAIMGIIMLIIYNLIYKASSINFLSLLISGVVSVFIYFIMLIFAKNKGYY